MKFSDCLYRLANGPVGLLALGGEGAGVFPADKAIRVLPRIQQALTLLHGRFPLSTKTIQLSVTSGKFLYPLRADFAQTSASAEEDKFIIDSVADPFLGDVLAVEHIYDSDKCEVGLNDRKDCTSWFTPAYDVLSMDYPVTGDLYFVEYRADHKALTVDYLEEGEPGVAAALTPTTLNQEIRIPPALEAAFLARIAYEVYCGIGGEDAMFKAQDLLGKYEAECVRLELQNTLNGSVVENRHDTIRERGWV